MTWTHAVTERKWQVVAMLFFAGGLNYIDRTSIAAVLPLIQHDLHATDVQLGAIGSAFLWSYALAAPFGGWLADRVSRSRLIAVSLGLWSLVMASSGLVTTIPQMIVLRVLLGFAECVYIPASVTLIADHHADETRATAMGIHLAGLNLAVVVGGTLSGYLGEHFGWRIGLLLLGTCGLLLAVMAWFVLTDGPVATSESPGRADLKSTLAGLIRVPTYWIIVAEEVLTSMGIWMFYNWMPLYFRETFRMSLTEAAFYGTFMLQSAAILGISVGGVLSDRVTRSHPVRRMYLLGGFFCASAPFLLVFLFHPDLRLLAGCIFAFSLLRTLGQSNESPVMCDLFPKHRRAIAFGVMNCGTMTAGGAGVLAAGVFKSQFGLGGIFAAVSAAVFISGVLVLAGAKWFYDSDMLRVTQSAGVSAVNDNALARDVG